MAELAPVSYQQALDELSKIADGNGNCFRIKVVRRPNAASSVSQHIATFGNATWQHIADAESWLGSFCGGGIYILQIFDGKDGRKQYGTVSPSEIVGTPRPPNPNITKSAAWLGPELISAGNVDPGVNGSGAVALSAFSGLGGEPYTLGAPSRAGVEAGLSSLFDEVKRDRAEIERKAAELAERERRAEVDQIRRDAEQRAKALEARIAEALVGLKAPPPPPPPEPKPFDFGALLTGLAPIVTTLVTVVTSSAAEDRKMRADLEARRIEREAQDRAREREEREIERKERVALAGRPLIDPQILEIMDRQAKRAEEQTSQFSNFLKMQAETARTNMESQAVAQRTMIQTIADVAQLQLKVGAGAEEKEGIDWGKIVAGALSGLAALKGGPQGMPPGYGAPGQPGMAPGQLGAPPPPPAPAQPLPEVDPSPLLDAIETRIRNKDAPDLIIADLKIALEDQGVKAEIEAEGGLSDVFDARLEDFAQDQANAPYLTAFIQALQAAGINLGTA